MWWTVSCGGWRKASVKLLCIIIGTGRSMLRPRPLTLATHILVRASSRVRPWTRVHSFFLHAQYLYYAFSLKSAFRHPPQPPFLHTSPNSWEGLCPVPWIFRACHPPVKKVVWLFWLQTMHIIKALSKSLPKCTRVHGRTRELSRAWMHVDSVTRT